MDDLEKKFWKFILNIIMWMVICTIIIISLWCAFDYGQSKVDRWEEQTGRYGEGLR